MISVTIPCQYVHKDQYGTPCEMDVEAKVLVDADGYDVIEMDECKRGCLLTSSQIQAMEKRAIRAAEQIITKMARRINSNDRPSRSLVEGRE